MLIVTFWQRSCLLRADILVSNPTFNTKIHEIEHTLRERERERERERGGGEIGVKADES